MCVFGGLGHLNASLLVNAGVDVKTVQSCLGHSTPTTTLQIYLHTFQSAQARAMDAVAEVLPIGTKFPKNNIKIA
ncbi:MAG: tyrosine-type recombinase/integrase [Ruminiclostridium sp.]|nr:tyrosine-type recombinase/integrase [Ruminiclostridium sp.]